MHRDSFGNREKESAAAAAWPALVVDIINTPEVRRILTAVSAQWLRSWSGQNPFKKSAARPTAWVLNRMLSTDDPDELVAVFAQSAHVEALVRQLPVLRQHLATIALAAARAVQAMPAERKKELIESLLAPGPADAAPSGDSLLAAVTAIAEEIYSHDPHFFSARLLPLLEQWIGHTDFGEVKALLDLAGSDLTALLRRGAGLIFDYPAKLIALLALVPDAVNLLAALADSVLERLNALPPDILADLGLTLFRQVDAEAVGRIVNRVNEAIRQLHTGSTLIGEMNAPRFSADLREKIRAVVAQIEPEPAIKARNAIIDGRETLIGALIDTAREHPDYLNLWLAQLAVKRNANLRLLNRKLQVFETLPEAAADAALSAGLSSWNAYDLAEMVNTLGRTLNRISAVKPDLFPGLVAEFVDSVDTYELEETLDLFSRDLGRVIRPLFRMAAPPIIRELCGFFEPGEDDDGYDEAMAEAKQRLQKMLAGKEDQ